MGKGQLYFFIGLPRSGKSTISNLWVTYEMNLYKNGERDSRRANGNYLRKLFPQDKPRAIVSGDDIRLALTGQRFCAGIEKTVNATKYLMTKTLLLRGHDVLMDSTNTTEKSIIDILREHPDAIPHWVDVSREECERRAIESNQEDLIDHNVIGRMSDSISNLMEKYNCPDMNAIVEFIREDIHGTVTSITNS